MLALAAAAVASASAASPTACTATAHGSRPDRNVSNAVENVSGSPRTGVGDRVGIVIQMPFISIETFE